MCAPVGCGRRLVQANSSQYTAFVEKQINHSIGDIPMRDTLTMDLPVDSTNSMAKRATAASTVGSALEWIDFTAYGAVAATVFPKIFFSHMDPNMGILAAFATFGIGFFARPLGGLFFGMLGDRIGRKNILLYTLSVMGASSFLIGCLPTYATIGFAAPLCL